MALMGEARVELGVAVVEQHSRENNWQLVLRYLLEFIDVKSQSNSIPTALPSIYLGSVHNFLPQSSYCISLVTACSSRGTSHVTGFNRNSIFIIGLEF